MFYTMLFFLFMFLPDTPSRSPHLKHFGIHFLACLGSSHQLLANTEGEQTLDLEERKSLKENTLEEKKKIKEVNKK